MVSTSYRAKLPSLVSVSWLASSVASLPSRGVPPSALSAAGVVTR